MAGTVQRIYQDRAGDAQDIAQGSGVLKFLLQTGQVRVILTRMGFVGVNKNRSDIFIGKIFRDPVHGWARQPAIWSGKTTELHHSESVFFCFRL